ncbi:hypothetical protein C8J57DRAFT_1246481 [Mycena rebaudengoi]|nr:hypothetical protein C8J57DRAFT_1246481 [Mycena rebaudengoi]
MTKIQVEDMALVEWYMPRDFRQVHTTHPRYTRQMAIQDLRRWMLHVTQMDEDENKKRRCQRWRKKDMCGNTRGDNSVPNQNEPVAPTLRLQSTEKNRRWA